MQNIKKIYKYSDRRFKRSTGVSKRVFHIMVDTVAKEFKLTKVNGGRKRKHSIPILILIFLEYYRHYIIMDYLASVYSCHESTICRIISTIEKILINSDLFKVKGKGHLIELNDEILVTDVTESEIERPTKNQKAYYSGKKKKHSFKTQIIINKNTFEILSVDICKGKVHDFQLFKDSQVHFNESITIICDSGYQGIKELHKNSIIPQKKSKGKELTKEQKSSNRLISSQRIIIEHVNRFIKIFRIISTKYRNKGKKFALRMNLISGIYNLERVRTQY